MIVRKPAYYDRFRCIAGACPDSCCKEWMVDIDEKTAELYGNLPGALGDDLRKVLKTEDDGPVLEITPQGRCPMWRQDGLCRIQAELGEACLSQVCRTFPRLTHDYGDFVEHTLELSCPEAARLILQEDAAWQEVQIPESGDAPDYDADTMAALFRGRQVLIAILQDESLTVPQVLAAALYYGYHLQAELDGEAVPAFNPAQAAASAEDMAQEARPGEILDFFRSLEVLSPEWGARLSRPETGEWHNGIRRIGVYFAQRYVLQAVSDGDIAARVKLLVVSCLVIHLLGGNLRDTAQRYSKEIENDAENLDALLDGFYFTPALSDRHVLSCLFR